MVVTRQEREAPSRRGSRRAEPGHRAESGYRAASVALEARLSERAQHNTDNLTRTAFYRAYWQAHPEVTWALLAHLVSRNAGYQMTDLRRHIERCQRGSRWLGQVGGRLAAALRIERAFTQLVRFLEAGNYLIFHDAYAQLAAYAAAKEALVETGCWSARRVFGDLVALGVDPAIVGAWRRFFEEGERSGFFAGLAPAERRAAPAVVRMALASVVNEQSYLEDRLLVPLARAPRYVDPEAPFTLWFGLAAALGLTRLVFPMAAPDAPERAERLLVHTLGAEDADAALDGAADREPWRALHPLLGGSSPASFASLRTRIDTGRALYFGLFLASPERAERVERWAIHGPAHTGERSVYDPRGYSPLSRRPGLLSRPLPEGPLSAWPGPPSSSLPAWSSRFPGDLRAVDPIRTDPFSGPLGWEAAVESSRPLAEVVDPARLWRG